jgi:hypothetical protein
MFRLRALAVTAGMALLGIAGIQGTGHAATIKDCYYTVTAAGNGMQVLSSNFATAVATLQTGQVYDLFNTDSTENGIRYRNDESFGHVGDWYPITNLNTGVVYLSQVPNSCSIDNF